MTLVLLALRWVIAVPAGLAASVLVMFPVHWGILLLYSLTGSSPETLVTFVGDDGEVRGCGLMGLTCLVSAESLERVAQAFVTPFVTLTVVARLVPTQKFYAVAALCVLYLVVFGAIMGLAVVTGGGPMVGRVGFEGYSGWRWLEFVAVVAIGISGAVAPFYRQLQTWRDTR